MDCYKLELQRRWTGLNMLRLIAQKGPIRNSLNLQNIGLLPNIIVPKARRFTFYCLASVMFYPYLMSSANLVEIDTQNFTLTHAKYVCSIEFLHLVLAFVTVDLKDIEDFDDPLGTDWIFRSKSPITIISQNSKNQIWMLWYYLLWINQSSDITCCELIRALIPPVINWDMQRPSFI